MAITLLGAPFSAFYDNNGAPLNGGLVYTYVAGTTTPKDTYTTSSGLIANTNPVVLDAGGRAPIWLNGSYKIIIKDALGNIIGTPSDNITSPTATGNMSTSTYDPASVNEQLVGITATQTLSNKTLNSPLVNQPNIVGVTNNSSAATGSVGEFQSSSVTVGSAVALTTTVAANITSLSLTAGDWDINGTVIFTTGTATSAQMVATINTTSATVPTAPASGAYVNSGFLSYASGAANGLALSTGTTRINISGTTTVYLITQSTFSVSTLGAYGFLRARRVR